MTPARGRRAGWARGAREGQPRAGGHRAPGGRLPHARLGLRAPGAPRRPRGPPGGSARRAADELEVIGDTGVPAAGQPRPAGGGRGSREAAGAGPCRRCASASRSASRWPPAWAAAARTPRPRSASRPTRGALDLDDDPLRPARGPARGRRALLRSRAHGAARVGGIGELVSPLPAPAPPAGVLLVTPPAALSTAAVFAELDRRRGRPTGSDAHRAASAAVATVAAALADGCDGTTLASLAATSATPTTSGRPRARCCPASCRCATRSRSRSTGPCLLTGSGPDAAGPLSFAAGAPRWPRPGSLPRTCQRGPRTRASSPPRRAHQERHHEAGHPADGRAQPLGPYSQAVAARACSSARARGPWTRRPASSSRAASRSRPSAPCATSEPLLEAAGLDYDDVVKTTCFLADIADFAAFNEVYARFFPEPSPGALDVPGGRACRSDIARRDRGHRRPSLRRSASTGRRV